MTDQILEKDDFDTSLGPLEVIFIGHGSMYFKISGKVIHVDPYSMVADYSQLPKADIILITHEHGDHMDMKAIEHIRQPGTVFIYTAACRDKMGGGHAMKNGDVHEVEGIQFEAVPAYNLVNKRDNGQPFHPRGVGNGYVLSMGGIRLYIGGDTEDIPEMANLMNIDIAFLPMNLPYTMTPAMVARAALSFKPRILYPYHYGQTSTDELIQLLEDEPAIEVRIRQMQ